MCVSLVLVSLLLMLSSCAGGGDSVLIKISKAMDELSSYEADGELNITAYCYNEKLSITGESKSIYSEEEDLYYYTKSDINVKHTLFTTSSSLLEAYNRGEYLLMYAVDGNETRIRSEHTEAEITEYFEDRSEFGSIRSGYSDISESKNERNGYDVKLWNYDEKTIRTLNADLGFPLEKGGAMITDISVTISTHSNYLISEVNIDYIFSSNDFRGSEKTYFSNFGFAERDEKELTSDDYVLVDDARIVPLLMTDISSKTIADEGSFQAEISVYDSYKLTEKLADRSYNVSFEYKNDRFEFAVDRKEDRKTDHEKYENGKYTLNGKNEEDFSFYEAKTYIDDILDPFSFTPAGIYSIRKSNKNDSVIYMIDMYTSKSSICDVLEKIFLTANQGYKRSTALLMVEFKDNELVSMEYTVDAIGTAGLQLYIQTKTTFE